MVPVVGTVLGRAVGACVGRRARSCISALSNKGAASSADIPTSKGISLKASGARACSMTFMAASSTSIRCTSIGGSRRKIFRPRSTSRVATVGATVGRLLGLLLGTMVGTKLGARVVGRPVGVADGSGVGRSEGARVGCFVVLGK